MHKKNLIITLQVVINNGHITAVKLITQTKITNKIIVALQVIKKLY